ncbi:MAG: hypothetical protein KU29_06635 [Sulfurovum sp. FS06-10]|nr:MAG: hypothetical protein KU29_06635 [Sulfurovum sp. FS06-10]
MFGEFNEMILYHSMLIKMMLAVLIVGLMIPFLSGECAKTIKRMRIYMFVSHGLLTMIAFSGMVAFVFADMAFNLSIVVMIVAFFAMIGIEVVKYKKILKSRLTAVMYTILNIAIIAGLVVWKIMEHKSAIPLS